MPSRPRKAVIGTKDADPAVSALIQDPTSATAGALRAAFVPQAMPAGITGVNRFDPTRSIYNVTSANLRKTRSKLGLVKSGTGAMRIVCGGTSITEGVGGAGRPNVSAYPTQLGQMFTARGYTSGGTGIVQTWNNNTNNVDGRWAFAAGWSGSGADINYQTCSTVSAAATFTSDFSGSTVDVVTLRGSGAFTVSIAGGAAQTVAASTGGGGVVNTYTTAITAGQTVVITPTTSSTVYLIGVQVRNTTGLLISNTGIGSSNSGNWAEQAAWNIGKMTSSTIYAPDLVIFEMPMNDALGAVSLSTFQANVTTAVNQWKTAGADVILALDPAPQTTAYGGNNPVSTATWTTYQQAMYSLADSLAVPLMDLTDMFGLRATIVANGIDYDGVHLNSGGLAAVALGVMIGIAA
jgi:lysophospholipase L1-like esterase